MKNTVQINIPIASVEKCEILIATLSEIGFYAFQENQDILSAYIKEEHFDEELLILNLKDISNHYTKIIIPDTNWNQKWEEEFTPVVIEDFVAIRAAFHQSVKRVKHEIIITPKMSFGTGHHATTYLMLQEMKEIDFNDKNVLDFGTGTGILAIMAKKLGAKTVTAIDSDDWSIENARENFDCNRCKDICLIKEDSIMDVGIFDIVLSNINLNVIAANIEGLIQASQASTIVLFSGFLRRDLQKVVAVTEKDFLLETLSQKDEWMCVKLKRT